MWKQRERQNKSMLSLSDSNYLNRISNKAVEQGQQKMPSLATFTLEAIWSVK